MFSGRGGGKTGAPVPEVDGRGGAKFGIVVV